MNKNIIIALLALMTLSSLGYAYYQKDLADRLVTVSERQESIIKELELEADKQRRIAQEQMVIANTLAMEARASQLAAEQALQAAKGKK